MTTPQQLLDLPLGKNDAQAVTVRDYFKALLTEVWREEEGFSGKRPFGNSSWQHEIYVPMAKAGFMPGVTVDEHGYIDQPSNYGEWVKARGKADELILAAIASL